MEWPPELKKSPEEDNMSNYGKRKDGTNKNSGYFGEIKTKDGKVITELSIGVNFGKGESEIPLVVPTLSREEIDYLANGGRASSTIINKAIEHAQERMKFKKSFFWNEGEDIYQLPDYIKK